MRMRVVCCVLSAILGTGAHGSGAIWSKSSGGNGHLYYAVTAPEPIDWLTANGESRHCRGFLVSLNSQAESDWVFSNIVDDPGLWFTNTAGQSIGPYIGLYQETGAGGDFEPDQRWLWVPSHQLTFNAWATGQPNDAVPAQDFGHYWSPDPDTTSDRWNDVVLFDNNGFSPQSYIVEVACPADLDRSGTVDLADLLSVLAVFGSGAAMGDVDCDGTVDLADLLNVLGEFGSSC